MKISGDTTRAPRSFLSTIAAPSPDSDLQLHRRPSRRQPRTPARLKRLAGGAAGKRSRPETPLSKWKIHSGAREGSVGGGGDPLEELDREKELLPPAAVSVRKLAAALWRLQLPETSAGDGGGRRGLRKISEDRLGVVQHETGHVDHQFFSHQNGMMHGSTMKNSSQSPRTISGTKGGHFCELKPSFQFSSTAMEGATKWDPVCLKTSDEVQNIYSQMKLLDQKVSTVSAVSALEAELEQARAQIQELETERHSSKRKLEHFLKKVGEERASWRSKEHEKIRAYVDDIKSELSRERKSRQRIEIVNSRLVNELADAKLLAKRYVQDYEKERKARELIEEICDELAKEIGEDKAEIEALKRESMKLREEVEEERKMLQMAEVWREERVHMKLIDAKVALDEKYSQMNKLVADLETFLKSMNVNPNAKEMKEARSLQQAAAAVDIEDIKGFSYEPANPDDIFSIFEDLNFGEPNEKDIESCVAYSPVSHASKIHTVSPEANMISKDNFRRCSNLFMDDNGDIEEDESGWETVSHVEDQGSSCSPEGSTLSVTKNRRESNASGRSVLEWEENAGVETPITEISEVSSVPAKQSKKVSSIARLWRSGPNSGDNYKIISVEGMNGRLSNGRVSNGGVMSPDWRLDKGELSPQDLLIQFSSPESANLHNRGMKGCIPRTVQKSSLKARLLEARMESQKVQLRHVLKHKI
ncbi:hypothetical protein PHAVU_006G042900 [Phaseolus vulgaris]|uniref:Uncharacterized protein n=1 Tax=Phaseolus vulgaris TaxID=3885 RepID=V7BPF4_PHAVU|nr:hypothetical protein PHAVU_006G042900g [Phaseolus vulgaris]ESW18461.1 hypothetical protein PHAVU_006G042900g [Phaseolus vulgaris]